MEQEAQHTKGCKDCHCCSNAGFDGAGLDMQGSNNKVYSEIVTEVSGSYSVVRVEVPPGDPENSVLLKVPTSGPQGGFYHPIQMFQGYLDPDYQKILSWITDGAPDN